MNVEVCSIAKKVKIKNLKFIYFKKATKFCKIFTLLLTGTTLDKSKLKLSQNFVAFSEYMNFISQIHLRQEMLLEFLKNSYRRNQIVLESAAVCLSDKILSGEVD